MRRYIPGACLLVAAAPKPPDEAASGVCLYQQGNERRYTVWASPASVPPLSPPCAVSITTNEPPLCCIRRFFSKPPFTTFVLAQILDLSIAFSNIENAVLRAAFAS